MTTSERIIIITSFHIVRVCICAWKEERKIFSCSLHIPVLFSLFFPAQDEFWFDKLSEKRLGNVYLYFFSVQIRINRLTWVNSFSLFFVNGTALSVWKRNIDDQPHGRKKRTSCMTWRAPQKCIHKRRGHSPFFFFFSRDPNNQLDFSERKKASISQEPKEKMLN